MDAEAKGDQHGNAHDTIENNAPHHGLGQLDGGILQFLTHVRAGIRTDEAPNRTGQADEHTETCVVPAAAIVEPGEGLLGWCMITHDPESDEEGEECENVHEEDDAFGEREMVSSKDVEGDGCDDESEHEKSDLPAFGEAGIRVVHEDHFLDHARELNAAGRDASNPADCRRPADSVGERLLH